VAPAERVTGLSDLAEPGDVLTDVDGMERFTLLSAGIDIGTSTSHVTISRLTLRRRGADLSTRFDVTERVVHYSSPVWLTPYLPTTLIDIPALEDLILAGYREAGVDPGRIDTGVVVVTGQALERENAEELAGRLAGGAGRFVCVSAGPHHEAALAAHGSGAVELSRRERSTVLNIDIGGGTTKFAVVRDGRVVETAAIEVGARLLVVDGDGRPTRLERPARTMMAALGYEIGDRVTGARRRELAELMVSLVFEAVSGSPGSPGSFGSLGGRLLLSDPLSVGLADVDAVVFSGGVSEYVYGREARVFDDLGPLIGAGVVERLDRSAVRDRLREPAHGIRATVIGAGEYGVQAGGLTNHVSDPTVLPLRGLQVVTVAPVDGGDVEADLRASLRRLDVVGYRPGLALALSFADHPGYRMLRRTAEAMLAVAGDAQLVVVVDVDVARSLGAILTEELRCPQVVIVVDGITVGELDHVDIGAPMGTSESLPVTVKSLVFPASARPQHSERRHHSERPQHSERRGA